MTFTVQTFVGRKYGLWAKSTARFQTEQAAQDDINATRASERKADATAMTRRVVKV
jgi:hypothetical protein